MSAFPVCRLVMRLGAALAVAACDRNVTTGALAAGAQPAALTVRPHDFVRRIRLTDLTEATRSYVVTTPLLTGATRGSMVVTRLAPVGAAVKPGDLLVQFDSQQNAFCATPPMPFEVPCRVDAGIASTCTLAAPPCSTAGRSVSEPSGRR
jgi:hypothetical protein